MDNKTRVIRAWELADAMCTAAEMPLYVVAYAARFDSTEPGIVKGWVGGEKKPSNAPFVALLKASELFNVGYDELLLTPVEGHPFSSGWKGGILTGDDDNDYIAAASGWTENGDLLVATVLNMQLVDGGRLLLHHFGLRHETREAMLAAVALDEATYHTKGIAVPADDHERVYVPIMAGDTPICYREHQYFPKGPHTLAVHWDLVIPKGTADFLGFLATILDVEAITWEHGPNDPWGVVWVDNKDIKLGVMAREQWWTPGE